jgi:hypothetical protein
MYAYVWRHLPGPWPARVVLSLAAAAGIVVLLFQVIFPTVEPHLPWSHDTVTSSVQQPGDYDSSNPSGSGGSSTPATSPSGAASVPAAGSSVLPGD